MKAIQTQINKEKVKIPEGVIGLEIHAYLVTKEKLFCKCKASRERGLRENIYICPICTGQPGAKPMLPNKSAVEKAVAIGLMLGCKINMVMSWQRKHYDWPDLPKGYQSTLSGKHANPIGADGKFYGITISSMHLEEDPASWNPESGEVDYNRSGLPLVEIITEPDFSTSEEVVDWLKKLLHALAYLKAVDSNAGIKVDVNVNIPGRSERVEIKNINSLDSIWRAIDFELQRQNQEGGNKRETRRFDDAKGKTMLMRGKEGAEDYRFISDPDLRALYFNKNFINSLSKKIPDSPEKKLILIIKKYKIDKKNAEILTKHLDIAEFFEKVAERMEPRFALPWVTIELLRLLKEHKTTLDKLDIDIQHFVSLLEMVKKQRITVLQGKQILKQFYPKSFLPSDIKEKISDEKELEHIIEKILAVHRSAVDSYQRGEENAFHFLMGEIMKATQKRADVSITRKVLERLLRSKSTKVL